VRAVEVELGEDCRPSIDRLKRRWVLCDCSRLLVLSRLGREGSQGALLSPAVNAH
jgi:hypothetical protein